MERAVVGGLIAAAFLWIVSGAGILYAVLAGLMTACLLSQLGPRSLIEKVGAGMTAGLIAWAAGPGSGDGPGTFRYMLGWLLASSALAAYVHPRAE
jgi:hypothetical protein